MKKFFLLCFISSLFSAHGFSAVVLTESFNYSDGALITVSGGKWVHHSGSTTGELNVASARVFVTSSEGEDVNASLQNGPYTTGSGVYLYASFTVNFSSLPTGTGTYFAHFKDSTTSGFRCRIFGTTNGAPSGMFRIGIGNAASAANVILGD